MNGDEVNPSVPVNHSHEQITNPKKQGESGNTQAKSSAQTSGQMKQMSKERMSDALNVLSK